MFTKVIIFFKAPNSVVPTLVPTLDRNTADVTRIGAWWLARSFSVNLAPYSSQISKKFCGVSGAMPFFDRGGPIARIGLSPTFLVVLRPIVKPRSVACTAAATSHSYLPGSGAWGGRGVGWAWSTYGELLVFCLLPPVPWPLPPASFPLSPAPWPLELAGLVGP